MDYQQCSSAHLVVLQCCVGGHLHPAKGFVYVLRSPGLTTQVDVASICPPSADSKRSTDCVLGHGACRCPFGSAGMHSTITWCRSTLLPAIRPTSLLHPGVFWAPGRGLAITPLYTPGLSAASHLVLIHLRVIIGPQHLATLVDYLSIKPSYGGHARRNIKS